MESLEIEIFILGSVPFDVGSHVVVWEIEFFNLRKSTL